MKIILTIVLNLSVFLISETSQSPKPGVPAAVVLKLNPPEGVLKSSSEVRLYVSVKNATDHEVGIVRSPGEIPEEQVRYQVDVRDSDGKTPDKTPYFKNFDSPSTMVRMSNRGYYLKPGESVKDAIVVSKLYVLKGPGIYRVWVSRAIPDLGGAIIKSNEVSITIAN